ncbi:MAG: hypothetical protein CMM41_02095 [Rhodospirillaceae bacterium]|nr:hypothetical protein [Rhodospirillaceae bacterium]|tara:strand:+ start:254 stop:592 length:339 start_codon:yes stop_codon:yes gene_type:complete
MSQKKYKSFKEFWPIYLRAHQKPATRFCHYLATVVGIGCALGSVIFGVWWLVPLGIFLGYSIAVASHPIIEGNKALVGSHAVWAALSDLKMFVLAASGKLQAELVKHGIKEG